MGRARDVATEVQHVGDTLRSGGRRLQVRGARTAHETAERDELTPHRSVAPRLGHGRCAFHTAEEAKDLRIVALRLDHVDQVRPALHHNFLSGGYQEGERIGVDLKEREVASTHQHQCRYGYRVDAVDRWRALRGCRWRA